MNDIFPSLLFSFCLFVNLLYISFLLSRLSLCIFLVIHIYFISHYTPFLTESFHNLSVSCYAFLLHASSFIVSTIFFHPTQQCLQLAIVSCPTFPKCNAETWCDHWVRWSNSFAPVRSNHYYAVSNIGSFFHVAIIPPEWTWHYEIRTDNCLCWLVEISTSFQDKIIVFIVEGRCCRGKYVTECRTTYTDKYISFNIRTCVVEFTLHCEREPYDVEYVNGTKEGGKICVGYL